MVFVPVPAAAAVALRDGQRLTEARGFAATASLLAAVGSEAGQEEVDYVALNAAGVAALDGLAGSRRLVLAVETGSDQVLDRRSTLGEVRLEGLRWDQVQALFADEPYAAADVTTAAAAATGVPLDRLLELPAVSALADRYDLLWFAVEELDELC